jgi:uncharacterized membrane protein
MRFRIIGSEFYLFIARSSALCHQVNFQAGLEIRHLHEKIDHLLNNQLQRLSEIQRLQVEMLQSRR